MQPELHQNLYAQKCVSFSFSNSPRVYESYAQFAEKIRCPNLICIHQNV